MAKRKTHNKDGATEAAILQAAKDAFIERGFAGARMQEIADKAGINKALLHYYFRSKDKLFQRILQGVLDTTTPVMFNALGSDKPIMERLEILVHDFLEVLCANPHYPMFIMHELSRYQEEFVKRLTGDPRKAAAILHFFASVEKEVAAGKLRPIQPAHLMLNITSLIVFPFVTWPMLKNTVG
ncbi:MAG: TetR/AcrR family transcriptional regulator [Bacteroidota bacterium]